MIRMINTTPLIRRLTKATVKTATVMRVVMMRRRRKENIRTPHLRKKVRRIVRAVARV